MINAFQKTSQRRRNNIFSKTHQSVQLFIAIINQPTSLDGKKLLDKELVNFDEKCQQNKEMWYKNYSSSTKLEKIFITDEDRKKYHDIENKTKREIEQMVKYTRGIHLTLEILHFFAFLLHS